MNELIRLKCLVPLSLYDPELDWDDSYQMSAPIEFQRAGESAVQLEWYAADAADEKNLRAALSKVPFLEEPESERITSGDWQSYWKEHFHVQRIGRHIVLVPEWQMDSVKPDPDDFVLLIRPGLGFGTGDHFTTSYCLSALEEYLGKAATFADVGTGSGILAVAAVKMGCRDVLAFDHDPLACTSAQDTFSLNGVDGQINLECCDLEDRELFKVDLVCANLFDTTLIKFAERLADSAARFLVLTGIRFEHADEVIRVYQSLRCILLDQSRNTEWCGLVFSTQERSRGLLPVQDSIQSADS